MTVDSYSPPPEIMNLSTRILTLSVITAAPLLSQEAARFDPARLVPRSDSFVVIVQGRAIGGARESIERAGAGYRLTSSQQMAGMSQSTVVEFSRTLAMTSIKQTGQARGQNMNIDVAYAAGRAKGSATTPGAQGMKTITVDAAVPAGVVDDNAMQSLLPALPLAEGKVFSIPVFASGQGVVKTLTATVAGVERVTVPAGTFDAWKLTITGAEVPVTFWISKETPKVVKLGFAGAPMSFELVK